MRVRGMCRENSFLLCATQTRFSIHSLVLTQSEKPIDTDFVYICICACVHRYGQKNQNGSVFLV